MKKFVKLSAVAVSMVLALAGCSSEDDANFQTITDDEKELEISAGTYKYTVEYSDGIGEKVVDREIASGTLKITGTSDTDPVSVESLCIKFSDEDLYSHFKRGTEKEYYIFNDEECTATRKKSFYTPFKEFKEKFLTFPQDGEIHGGWFVKYTEKSLVSSKSKVELSYKFTSTNKDEKYPLVGKEKYTLELQ